MPKLIKIEKVETYLGTTYRFYVIHRPARDILLDLIVHRHAAAGSCRV
jgi:hypothetical protein